MLPSATTIVHRACDKLVVELLQLKTLQLPLKILAEVKTGEAVKLSADLLAHLAYRASLDIGSEAHSKLFQCNIILD